MIGLGFTLIGRKRCAIVFFNPINVNYFARCAREPLQPSKPVITVPCSRLLSFPLSEVSITVENKEFNIQKAMIKEVKRYQKEVHGKYLINPILGLHNF